MDPQVLDAVARWPDVPAVFGWLSLDGRGRYRLHPGGDANEGGEGQSISNTQILAFMARNCAHDDAGRWYFQNGPQRVYLRIDAAPLILRGADRGDALVAHTGQAVLSVTDWWLDDAGALYASTDIGPGIVEDRDLPAVMNTMTLPDGQPALDAVAGLVAGQTLQVTRNGATATLHAVTRREVPRQLGFSTMPTANTP